MTIDVIAYQEICLVPQFLRRMPVRGVIPVFFLFFYNNRNKKLGFYGIWFFFGLPNTKFRATFYLLHTTLRFICSPFLFTVFLVIPCFIHG